jgi:hypothetical protein
MADEAMADELRVELEIGLKGKRVVAVAPDGPGLERGAKTGEAALARLHAYRPRYAPVAQLAAMGMEFAAIASGNATVDVVEQYAGTGSTDFWGISFAFSQSDRQAMSSDELDRELILLQACWACFDAVRARVSAELHKGPRGGGRDRDRIVRHVLGTEQGKFGAKLGLRAPEGALLTQERVRAYRDGYCAAIRALPAQGKPARSWPLR